jgi:hypothetical protein
MVGGGGILVWMVGEGEGDMVYPYAYDSNMGTTNYSQKNKSRDQDSHENIREPYHSMTTHYDSSYDRTEESESEDTDKSNFVETDSDEEQNSHSYSSGAFGNADYGNLDYDTGDDIDDPAFLISMSTRSKTESSLPSALNEGNNSTRKRSRARLSDPDPRDLSKRPRTGGGGVKGKGKGPTNAKPHAPLPPPTSLKSTTPPPSNPTFPPSQHAVDTQPPPEPTGEPTMPHIDPKLPQRKRSFQEWVDKLLSPYVLSLSI